jgi:hypothetical protein
MFKMLILCVLAVGMSGQPNHAKNPKDGIAQNQQPPSTATYTYDSNCCTTQASHKRDDKPAKWYASLKDPNWWVVIVTALTGAFIGWQAWETRKAAGATIKQGEIQRDMLRPRLAIGKLASDAYKDGVNGEIVFIKLRITNSGGMPAYGVSIDSWIEFLDRGDNENRRFVFTPNALHHSGTKINVDTANPQGFQIPFNRSLTDEEIYKMSQAIGTICFRIRMEYLAFGDKVYTDHGFELQPGCAHDIPEYTSAT